MQCSMSFYVLRSHTTRQVFYAFRLSFSISVSFDFATGLKLYTPQRTLSGRQQTPLAMMLLAKPLIAHSDRKLRDRHNHVKRQAWYYARKYQEMHRFYATVTPPPTFWGKFLDAPIGWK